MLSYVVLNAVVLLAPAAIAAPAATASYVPIPASAVSKPPPPPVVSPQVTGPTSHGPYTGTPTTTGALSLSVLAPSIPALPPNPTATTYPSDGQLHDPEPAPYTPAGGLGTNGTEPVYNAKSDFDYESLVSPFTESTNFYLISHRLLHCTKNGLSLTSSMTDLQSSVLKSLKRQV